MSKSSASLDCSTNFGAVSQFYKGLLQSLCKEMLGDNGESLEVLCIYSIKSNTTKWI